MNLIKESNVNDNKSLKINTIQITSYNNKNEQFIKKRERKIDNNISPINENNKMIIKILYTRIDKTKINSNKYMMSKPEIVLKEIISYNNNRVDTKRIIRNYRYKGK
ncbi:hypothetical protein H8356DRAFT_1331822 [Neocallimastix lanati (nom. inval.)]|nr:hypothetical protein H8356DRAFT_1331822 [Neocallimastix sp. JGI-2020a]